MGSYSYHIILYMLYLVLPPWYAILYETLEEIFIIRDLTQKAKIIMYNDFLTPLRSSSLAKSDYTHTP